MTPTRPWALALAATVAGLLAAGGLHAAYLELRPLPNGPPVTVALVAVFVGLLAASTRNRLRGKGKPVDPLAMARYVALAKAASGVGALAFGAWAGVLLFLIGQRGQLSVVGHDRRLAIAGVVTGLLLAAAGQWLEWLCRVRPRAKPDPGRR